MLPVVHINSRNAFWIVALIVIATLLPFLGETMFNSKGEPREAIVAVSMLNSGDWILPVSNGDVIPYKPPFMAWCIALFSLLAGHVTEYTSRLPSALALIVLVLWSYRFLPVTTAGRVHSFARLSRSLHLRFTERVLLAESTCCLRCSSWARSIRYTDIG